MSNAILMQTVCLVTPVTYGYLCKIQDSHNQLLCSRILQIICVHG